MRTLTNFMRPRLLIAAGLAAGAVLCSAAPALASDGTQYGSIGQYGEAFRGGGFDTCWFDAGAYDGKGSPSGGSSCTTDETEPTPGEFIDPVGFTVDPTGSQSIYVLDRISALPSQVTGSTTSWRLQKLSATGTVEGIDEFSLPANTTGITNDEMYGLAVDPTTGVVYSLLVGYDTTTGNEVAQEILSWSTTPSGTNSTENSEPELDGTATADTISAGISGYPTPGVTATQTDLTGGAGSAFDGEPDIESPTGIAIDTTGGIGYVAVQTAQDPTTNGDGAGLVTVDPATGAIGTNWSSGAFAGLANDSADEINSGAGISTDPVDGSLTWLDDTGSGTSNPNDTNSPEDFDVASLPASLSTPTILSSPKNGVTNGDLQTLDLDDAAISTDDVLPETTDSGGTAATNTSSPQVVALSNGLYAAVFAPEPSGSDDPSNPVSQPGIFTEDDPGIRLLQPDGNGLLSESTPPLTTLFDTLGNTVPNSTGTTAAASACSLTDSTSSTASAPTYPSLAAGASGAIWVLTNGQDSSGDDASVSGTGAGAYEGGRQLIELSPGASDPCPGPSGTFTESSGSGTPVTAGSSPLTVTAGTTVTFDASGIQYPSSETNDPSAARAAYEWDFGNSDTTTNVDGNVPPFTWPGATASEKYTTPGDYTVTLDLYGDYGEYVETGQVDVTPATAATASFTYSPTSPKAGQTVTFNGSKSTPSSGGSSISEYEWDFGDNTQDVTTSPTDTHIYASAGTYTVKLTVIDNDGYTSSAKSETITVSKASTTTTPPPRSNKFTLGKLTAEKNHSIEAKLGFTDAGKISIKATFTDKVTKKVKGKKKTVSETKTFATATKSVSSGSTTVTLSPSSAAKSYLKSLSDKSSVSVKVDVTFTPTGGTQASHSATVKIKGEKAPKKKKKK